MAEVRRLYRVSSSAPDEVNRALSSIGERLDQLEGYRGTPTFLKAPISKADATKDNEVLTKQQVDTTSLAPREMFVYAQDDSKTKLHGFGEVT